MGTRNAFCVEPPVITCRKLKSKLLILIIIFSDIDMVSVAAHIVKRFACNPLALLLSLYAALALHVAALYQLFLNLHQIRFLQRNIKGCADGGKMIHLCLCLRSQCRQRLIGAL